MKTLIIDNFDSFTYNLYQYVAELGGNPEVFRNNKITLPEIESKKYTHIIISPGPGTPEKKEDFGICSKVIQILASKMPILGVCLGHQGIISTLGGKIIRAPFPVHGKRSLIHIKNHHPLFKGLPKKIEGMRYHSLIGERKSIPQELEIIAETDDGLIMGIAHKKHALYGVQFHPESIGTPCGKDILKNFLFNRYEYDAQKNKGRGKPKNLGTPEENARLFLKLIQGKGSKALRNLVILNAAFGLKVAEKVQSIEEGKKIAYEALKTGAVQEKFLNFKTFTQKFS